MTVTITTDTSRLALSASVLTFTTSNWATVQHITLTAVNDSTIQGEQFVTLHHAVTSTDARYNGLSVPDLIAQVEDNDIGGVLIRESGGTTRVIEVDPTLSTAFTAPFIDSYTVVLTKAPTATVTVHIAPALTETGGTVSQTFAAAGGATASFLLSQAPRGGLVTRVLVDGNRLARTEFHLAADGQTLVLTPLAVLRPGAVVQVTYQVDHSDITVAVSRTGIAGSFTTDGLRPRLHHRQLERRADGLGRGRRTTPSSTATRVQVFASQPRTLAPIQGPLDIEGGADPAGVAAIPPPVLYVARDRSAAVPAAIRTPTSRRSSPSRSTSLQALNTDSLANSTGVLDRPRI